jgi:hypothetical protein
MAQEPLYNQTEVSMAWDDLRTSPAFPAIVGGVAGALGGVALMFVLTRLTQPKQALPAAYDADGNPVRVVYLPANNDVRILGFTPGDLITLVTLGASLYSQVRAWATAQDAKETVEETKEVAADVKQDVKQVKKGVEVATGVPMPPSPSEAKPAAKK